MITKKEIDFFQGVVRGLDHNETLLRELREILELGGKWLNAAESVRKASFKDMEAVLSINKEWEKNSVLHRSSPEALEAAIGIMKRLRKSALLKKTAPQSILEALMFMETWNRHSQLRNATPRDLLDAYEAFKGKSPSELQKGDTLAKALKSSKLKSKSRQQIEKILTLYSF